MGGRGGSSTAVGKTSLGTVTVNGKEVPLMASVSAPSDIQWKASPNNRFEIGLTARGIAGGDRFGGIKFWVNKETGVARVEFVSSAAAVKGQSVGNRLYAQAMLIAKENGAKTFVSDRRVSHSAVASWERLSARLPAGSVTRSASVRESNQLVSKSPLFSVNLSKVSSTDLNKISKNQR